MRIIAGKYKSQKIKQVPLLTTRETSDKIRGACFNMLGNISNYLVLDLFSGSGSYGLESVSRGANKVYMIDNNKIAFNIINENIKKLSCHNETEVYLISATDFLKNNFVKFDLVFLDLPYDFNINNILDLLKNHLNHNFTIVYEHTMSFKFDVEFYEITKKKKYGQKYLTFLSAK